MKVKSTSSFSVSKRPTACEYWVDCLASAQWQTALLVPGIAQGKGANSASRAEREKGLKDKAWDFLKDCSKVACAVRARDKVRVPAA